MSDDAVVGSGNVAITLGDKEFQLVPTLNAAQVISRNYNGIRNAVNACSNWDIDAITKVIETGIGRQALKDGGLSNAGQLAEVVWKAGFFTETPGELLPKCIEFLHVLNRGGRPLPDTKDEGATGDDAKNPPNKSA